MERKDILATEKLIICETVCGLVTTSPNIVIKMLIAEDSILY
jgi:hypothetical protein